MRREITYVLRNRWQLASVTLLPLLTIGVGFWIFVDGTPRHLPIAVIDEDRSRVSNDIVLALRADPNLQVAYQAPSGGDPLSPIRGGRVYGTVVLQSGLQRDLEHGHLQAIPFYINSQSLLTTGILSRELQTVVGIASISMQATQLGKKGAPAATAVADVLPLSTAVRSLYNPRQDYETYLGDPIVFSILALLVVLIATESLGRELRDGTAREWIAISGGVVRAILGKLTPYFAIFCMYSIAAAIIFSIREGSSHGIGIVLLATVLLVAAYAALSVAIVGITGNIGRALSLASLYTAAAFAFAGVTFPLTSARPFARWFSASMPLPYYLELRTGQLQLLAPAYDAARDLLVLVFFVLFGLGIGMLGFRSVLRNDSGS